MKLLEPLTVKNVTFKNRIMFPPLTTGYEEKDGSIGEQSLSFYTRLAKGGTAYIVLGDVVPIPTFSPTPKLFMDAQIPGFKALADSLHAYGAKVGLQIFHPEYDADGLAKLFAAGKMQEGREKLHHDMLHFSNEVTEEQLQVILGRFQACVKRMVAAGIDVVEIHGDRLVGSLCSPIINHRNDEFGGSFENRVRFALMVVKAIKEVSGDMLIEYKLPIITKQPDGSMLGKGGLPLEEAVELAKLLEANGVDMIHVAQANHTGNMNDTIPAMGTRPYNFMLEECKAVKKAVSIPVSLVGRIVSPMVGEALVEQGVCDMVSYGRSLLADPDFANKLQEGKPGAIRECIMCNKGCTDAITSRRFLSCVLNAENGFEATRHIEKAAKAHRVAVVGAGVAGLEAARVLTLRGHRVEVFEKSLSVGGQINIASVPPRKEEMRRLLSYFEYQMKELGVQIHLNCEFTKEMAKDFDDVFVAIGAHNADIHFPGYDLPNVLSAWDVLANRAIPFGKVIVCGGGLVGTETAEYLAERGYSVEIVEMQEKIAKEESSTILPTILKSFDAHHVGVHTLSKIKAFEKDGVRVDTLNAEGQVTGEAKFEGDTIVTALTSFKNKMDFEGVNAHVVMIGDCLEGKPCTIENAIKSAYDAACSLN